MEELKKLNLMLTEMLSQLRGVATNINQIARKTECWWIYTKRQIFCIVLNKNILNYRKESEKIWLVNKTS